MAEEIIKVACPGCGAQFELPPEMGGEIGECTECGATFEIPKFEAIKEGTASFTDTGSIKVSKMPAGATNTIKLSRSSIGMVPEVKDTFKFTTVTETSTHAAVQQHSYANGSKAPAAPAGKKPWWQKLLFFWKK